MPDRRRALLLFGLLAGAVVAAEYGITHRADFGQHAALPPAVAFDLLVVLPALAYWLLVRRARLPASVVAAVFGGCLAYSHWLLPAGGLPLLTWAGRLAQGLEVVTLGYTAVRLRRIWRGYQVARQHSADFLENLRVAAQPILGRFTGLVATEAAVVRYGLLSFGAAPEVGPGQVPFSTYRQSGFGALLAALAGLSIVELAAVHLVVARWYPSGAWALTALSAYSLLWLLAHGQAVRRRPVLLTKSAVVVRVGFAWQATVALTELAGIQGLTTTPPAGKQLLNTARLLLTPPNLLLTLRTPQAVHGLLGRQRLVTQLAFYVDEPAALIRQLAASPA